MVGKSWRRTLACVALAFTAVTATAAPYTSISVFGDSLSDGGNDYIYTTSLFGPGNGFPPPPYAQNFSNGPVAVTQLAANLGLPLAPSLAGGTNYAFGGAETGTQNFLRFRPEPPLAAAFGASAPQTGVLAQIASVPSGGITANTLVVLWAGANDVFSSLTSDPSGASLLGALGAALGNIQTAIAQLYGKGARSILLPNMPDIGKTPDGLAYGPATAAALTGAVTGFNTGLNVLAAGLEAGLPGLDIIPVDVFGTLNAVIANPAAFGFTNVTQPCFNIAPSPSLCADPASYLFWDGVHPTTRAAGILAGVFTAAVPEPSTTALLALALFALAAARRRAPR